jgi:hypothetical protein
MQKMAESIEKVEISALECDTLQVRGGSRARRHKIRVSPTDSDALYGLKTIAEFWCRSPGQARPLVEADILPTFKLPGSQTLCASKATLREAWRRYEAEWRDKHPVDINEKLRQRKQKRENPVNRRPIANAPAEEKTPAAATARQRGFPNNSRGRLDLRF